ncbi:hypothetical protein ABK040_006644 [Willaertia magna]
MSKQDGSLELMPARNALYLGNYNLCLSKIAQTSINENNQELKLERNLLLYRAHIGLTQYDIVLNEVDENEENISLKAIRLLAEYFNNNKKGSSNSSLLEKLDQLMLDQAFNTDPTFAIVAATIYSHEGNDISCLQAVHDIHTLEALSIQIKTLIRINRLDLAEHSLKRMTDLNEDATISHFTRAYVYLAKGGKDRLNDAENIFKELQQKVDGKAVPLLVGQALVLMQEFEFEDAEKLLLNALSLSTNDPEVLVNLISCSLFLRKDNSLVNRYLTQLKSMAPNHSWVKKYNELNSTFDQLVNKF